jgi:hypothetical protein
VERRRLRGLGWISLGVVAFGGLVVVRAGFRGPAALIGVLLLAAGLALLDAWARGRLTVALVGVFLLVLGLGVGVWTVGVILLLDAVDVPAAPELDRLLAASAAAASSGLVVVAGGALLLLADRRSGRPLPPTRPGGNGGGVRAPWWTGLRATSWTATPVANGLHPTRPAGRHPVHRPARG